MAPEKQTGLVGELLFLRRLVHRCHALGHSCVKAIDAWTGAESGKRDFFGVDIAVEVKTTGHVVRLHHIASLDQLLPHTGNERVFLFSVGIRRDLSAPKKLTSYVSDIESLLVDESGSPNCAAIEQFRKKLGKCGFVWADADLYERQEGFLAPHLPPELYTTEDLHPLTVNDFVNGAPPDTVRSISYALEVSASPLTVEEFTSVCDRMLR
jgi:hypothetical protein